MSLNAFRDIVNSAKALVGLEMLLSAPFITELKICKIALIFYPSPVQSLKSVLVSELRVFWLLAETNSISVRIAITQG